MNDLAFHFVLENMAATSMAAALAATLPASAPTPVAPQSTHDAIIPASMAKVVDIEAEIPFNVVQLDGMVRWADVRRC